VASIEFDPEADLISKNNTVTLSTSSLELEKSILLYPNPVQDRFTINKPEHLEVTEIKLFNIYGQILYQSKWSSEINTASFSSGILFVQLVTNQGLINKSVLKN